MKFSVLLPTYNRLDLLKYAIASVLLQNYADWELIISDNQSEDDVHGYIEALNEPRIHYSRTESLLNVTDNWNRVLSFATGDYVVMLGDDDALMPGYFEKLLAVIHEYNEPDWIYTEAYEYAYPNVLPAHPEGLLLAGRNPWFNFQSAAMFDDEMRLAILKSSFRMKLSINFNMQHSLVKRSFIQSLPGEFYQSVFPDYYATLAGVLRASNFVFYPEPMIVISITRKSHGFYYFNNLMTEAKNILHTDDINRQQIQQIDHLLQPGMDWIHVGWMASLYCLTQSFNRELSNLAIQIDLASIRKSIIRQNISNHIAGALSKDVFTTLKQSLNPQEYRSIFLPFYLYYTVLRFLGPLRGSLLRFVVSLSNLKQSNLKSRYLFRRIPVNKSKNVLDIIQSYPSSFDALEQEYEYRNH
jgi:glycosyltransferase involved in cell wall biosynthesis